LHIFKRKTTYTPWGPYSEWYWYCSHIKSSQGCQVSTVNDRWKLPRWWNLQWNDKVLWKLVCHWNKGQMDTHSVGNIQMLPLGSECWMSNLQPVTLLNELPLFMYISRMMHSSLSYSRISWWWLKWDRHNSSVFHNVI